MKSISIKMSNLFPEIHVKPFILVVGAIVVSILFNTVGTVFTPAYGQLGQTEPAGARGHGTIEPFSYYPSTQAKLGIRADGCDGLAQGRFTFQDKTVSPNVQLDAEVTGAAFCIEEGIEEDCGYCVEAEIVIDATYTDQSNLGAGSLQACLRVQGDGAVDNVFVAIYSGPFAGYYVEGPLRGNVQRLDCDG